jgi:hypothetical protein
MTLSLNRTNKFIFVTEIRCVVFEVRICKHYSDKLRLQRSNVVEQIQNNLVLFASKRLST